MCKMNKLLAMAALATSLAASSAFASGPLTSAATLEHSGALQSTLRQDVHVMRRAYARPIVIRRRVVVYRPYWAGAVPAYYYGAYPYAYPYGYRYSAGFFGTPFLSASIFPFF